MSDWLAALLLGILEGVSEFLPVSSTGHLLIAQHWLGARSDFFNIVIQAGAIVAVTLVFRQRIWALISGLGAAETRDYALKLATAFMVTAVAGLPVRRLGWELPETVTPVAWALVLGGIWMLIAERIAERRQDSIHVSWRVAVLVGLAQVVAGVFPGTSRSAAAIFIAMLAGLARRSAAAEFVFLVGIPTMFAASGYALFELWREGGLGTERWDEVGIAFLAASVTGFAVVKWLVVKWLMDYIKRHRFTGFAVYRLLLGAALLICGASSGFGAAAARRFLSAGWQVIATGRRSERLAELADAHTSARLHTCAFDIRNAEAMHAALDALPEAFRNIDVLVNNAGLALGTAPAYAAQLAQWQQMIDTNITALVRLTHALLPTLIERRGAIINISSIAASYPYPGGNVYGGSKAFVSQFSLGLRSDLHGTG